MLKFTEMDSNVTLIQQMEADISPVVLINRFTVIREEVDQLLKAWAADAAFLKTQPGCISAQLHRGIGGSCCFINVAVWESVAHFKQAFMHPSFQAHLKDYPPSTVASPHLFSKVAVPNICVAGSAGPLDRIWLSGFKPGAVPVVACGYPQPQVRGCDVVKYLQLDSTFNGHFYEDCNHWFRPHWRFG